MADFQVAYNLLMKNEGGYSSDSDDAGGETYKGVSRRYNPTWIGWSEVDKKKSEPNFPKNLESNKELQSMVASFYKQHYWDKLLCDEIDLQPVAEELFDTAVNMGVSRSSKFFQQALNLLNRNQLLYPDLLEDGKIGQKTMDTFEKCKGEDRYYLLKIMNILQGMHYITYMGRSPIQEKYARGWLNRVSIEK